MPIISLVHGNHIYTGKGKIRQYGKYCVRKSFLCYTGRMRNAQVRQGKFIVLNDRKATWKVAIRVSLLYLFFGLAWILLSDKAVEFLVRDPGMNSTINMAKGFLFVLISATLIYFLIAPVLGKLSDNEQVIREKGSELQVMVYYDYLTGLSNRRKLLERLPDYLKANPDSQKALFYIDIDNIKLINDTLGHIFGDALIAETAKKLSGFLEDGEELYRHGGDEFIILTRFRQIAGVQTRATKIIELFDKPLSVEKILVHSSISLGISLYPLHGTNPGELLKCADIAMYESKKNGKNRSILYNPLMMTAINERMTIGEQLHTALQKNELEVVFQPQIDTKSRRIRSYEALLRWTNPELGRVPPDKFISVAEENQLIIPIGEWVLHQACGFLRKMENAGFSGLTMSVNISIIQLLHENFVAMVERTLEKTGIDATKLELEITESVLMESYSMIKGNLDELKKRGIGIALDDFGKGYSSLSYLEQLPITVLKIDKIFIDGISEKDRERSLTGSIVGIGKKLGLTVIAEGVETESQLAYLAEQQCDKIQGWIFSKALSAPEAEAFTRKNLEA